MPTYTVTLIRTIAYTYSIEEIDAVDETAAEQTALEEARKATITQWVEDEDSIEVENIIEIETILSEDEDEKK